MKFDIDMSELNILEEKFKRSPRRVAKAVREVSDNTALFLLERLRVHASGRPGPNVITGEYIHAFKTMVTAVGGGVAIITAENPSPQAHRLEYGFYGLDSIGRNYAQPPYPHFRPAAIEAQKFYTEELTRLVRRGLW